MSNKKFNLKIATIASWVLLFFSWIFFYAVTQRPTAVFWVVLAVTLILTAITVIIEKNNIISLLKTRFVHKAFFWHTFSYYNFSYFSRALYYKYKLPNKI